MTAREPGTQESSGLCVLVVEDEMMVALLLEEMIADLGHRVVGPVGRLGKALELASSAAIDVAILDVNVDGQGVYPVAAALAARGIPFAFVTGYGREGVRESYRGSPTLTKPFQRQDLRELLEEIRHARQA